MSRLAWLAVVCGLALTAAPVFADDPKPAKKAPKVEEVDRGDRTLSTLALELDLGDKDVNETTLSEFLLFLSQKYDLTFIINEASFKQAGVENIKEAKPALGPVRIRGLKIRQFLTATLDSMGATYLLKNGAIEIVSIKHAANVTKSATTEDEGGPVRLNEPLVSLVVKEKPLNEVVARLAEDFDLNVIVAPQAGDAKAGFVTARLLNVPADKAIELLAIQCDLRVVRKGNAFLITSKDQANEIFNEKLDKERQKIEVEKLREAPAKPPAPPEKPPEK